MKCLLARSHAAAALALLGLLQSHLESAIESSIVPGTNEASPDLKGEVARDRQNWKRAEGVIKALEAEMHRTRKGER